MSDHLRISDRISITNSFVMLFYPDVFGLYLEKLGIKTALQMSSLLMDVPLQIVKK